MQQQQQQKYDPETIDMLKGLVGRLNELIKNAELGSPDALNSQNVAMVVTGKENYRPMYGRHLMEIAPHHLQRHRFYGRVWYAPRYWGRYQNGYWRAIRINGRIYYILLI